MMTLLEQLITWSKGLKILYVEDDISLREELSILLCDIFDVVDLAEDGQDGLDKVHLGNYDLIITDIRMPKLNGIEMIEKLKEDEFDIPIVVFSAHNEVDYLVKLVNLEIENFVTKPIKSEQIFSVLHKVVKRIHNQKELRRYQRDLEEANNKLKNIVTQQSKSIDFKSSILNSYRSAIYEVALVSIATPQGIIKDVNDNFCKALEYSKEEVIGNSYSILKHPDNDRQLYKELWKTIKNKQVWHGVILNQTKTFKPFYCYATIVPILDEKGEIYEYLSVVQDLNKIEEIHQDKLARSIESCTSIKQDDILKMSPFPSVLFDKKTKIMHYNRLFEKFVIDLEDPKQYSQLVSNDLNLNSVLDFNGLISIDDTDFIDIICDDNDTVSLETSADTIEGKVTLFLKIKKLDDLIYIGSIISKEDFQPCSLVQES